MRTLVVILLCVGIVAALSSDVAPAEARVTVSGCVARTAMRSAAPVGMLGFTTPPKTVFVLTTSAASKVVGTTGIIEPNSPDVIYRLDDRNYRRLSRYAGEKVEISGTVEDTVLPMDQGTIPMVTDVAPKLKVESVERIARRCAR